MHYTVSYYLTRARHNHQNVPPDKPTGSVRSLRARSASRGLPPDPRRYRVAPGAGRGTDGHVLAEWSGR
jgi:hypothetical protein